MALPKEPRQKMINVMYLVLTALLALNVSVEILNAFRTVQNSLQKSSKSIESGNTNLFEQLQAKLDDPKTKDQAAIYKPWADKAKALCQAEYDRINWYKDTLMRASGYNPAIGDTTFSEADIESPTRLFIEHDNGTKLLAELTDLRKNLLNINPEIDTEFSSKLPIDLSVPPSEAANGENTWQYCYFHMTPTIAALTMLSKFQNDIRNSENQIVTYCNNKIGSVKIIFNKFQPIATTSSTYVMPGEKFTVTAGVGAFSDQAKPQISIGGVPTPLNDKGVATKDITASGSGDQKIHVDIKYYDQSGVLQDIPTDIAYTVGHPAGASISLDKLNVFYIGLDNPITIGSPTGMDRTRVTGNNCSVNLTNGPHGNVRVTAPGECSITVAPQGSTPITLPFRIKRIPEPEFKVGSGKARMPSVEFKNQQFGRADMGADFIYDVHYSVVSATVYFSGANFPNVVTTGMTGPGLGPLHQYMERCGPGSVITFDNIKVTGPDGTRIIEGKSFALY